MLNYGVRFVKRFAVLIPGIAIASISINTIFPAFDRRFPLTVAILLTYVLGAYVLIPLLIRIVRIFFPAKHLQSYCVTPDGFASDPVNIGIIGSRQQLRTAMQAAGWEVADEYRLRPIMRAGICILLNHPYPTAPMSRLYLFGRKQDIGFEIAIAGERGQRHHVRFWATDYRGGDLNFGTIAWHRARHMSDGTDTLWIGAASMDIGLAFIRHNVQVTHMIHPDTNAERELIISGLQKHRLIGRTQSVVVHAPYRLANRALRGYLHSDGLLKIVKLQA